MVARRLHRVAEPLQADPTTDTAEHLSEWVLTENMDIEEFVKTVPPGKKTSRLNKYGQEIRELKAKGYTDEQIRDWLSRNGIQISREAVRRFVKKTTGQQATPVAQETEPRQSENIEQNESQAEKLRKRLAEQQNDADKARFKHDKTGNQN